MGAEATETTAVEGTEDGKKKVEDFIESFGEEDDFDMPEPGEDEKEGSEGDSSTSTGSTSDGDADGKEDDADETDSEERPKGKSGDKSEAEDDESSEAGTTIPKTRFDQVIAERNETRKANATLEARLAAIEEVRKQGAKKDEQESEEDEDDLDEPFTGTVRDFNKAVEDRAGKVADERIVSVRSDLSRFQLRLSEKEFRANNEDYDKIVYESDFFKKLSGLASDGDEEAQGIVRDILASDDPAAELYDAAREVQGLAPPTVEKLDANDWDQVGPVLKRLGLSITEDKWAERRKDSEDEKKSKGKKTDKPKEEDKGNGDTLRGAPSGSGDTGKNTDSEDIDLDRLFPN